MLRFRQVFKIRRKLVTLSRKVTDVSNESTQEPVATIAQSDLTTEEISPPSDFVSMDGCRIHDHSENEPVRMQHYIYICHCRVCVIQVWLLYSIYSLYVCIIYSKAVL